MLVSTKGRYALRIMTDLAEHQSKGYIPLKAVASRQGISEKYLRCFASSDRYNKLKSLYSSALADFFYVNTFELFCCLLLRFT